MTIGGTIGGRRPEIGKGAWLFNMKLIISHGLQVFAELAPPGLQILIELFTLGLQILIEIIPPGRQSLIELIPHVLQIHA